MKKLNVTPLCQVGDVHFGMSREEVRALWGTATEFKKSKYSKNTTDDFGFCHVFYDAENRCEAIEIFGEAEVVINGVTVFPGATGLLESLISDKEQDDSGFISKTRSIGVYAPYGDIESVLFGCKGYYE